MGALHEGHGQLIKSSLKQDFDLKASTLVSVFVNPLQFGPEEDFEQYPRQLEEDLHLVDAYGANAFWAPSVDEIFPVEQLDSELDSEGIEIPGPMKNVLCGRIRPGHFDGVAKVIARLMKLVQPNVLFLGEKDWQQLVIVRWLINALELPIVVRGIATVRDADGLAISSRNAYLTPNQRNQALALPRLLQGAAQQVKANKSFDLMMLRNALEQGGLLVDYLETIDPYSLQTVAVDQRPCLLAASLRCGNTRLIDHVFLMSRQPIVAIDGPAGAGKSTVTRGLAERLKLIYLDTGAMYRALTWLVQHQGIDPHDSLSISAALEDLELELGPLRSGSQTVEINGHDVTDAIRSPQVTAEVSVVAAHGCVRKAMTDQQQEMGRQGGLVAEGRDIGTAVFPQADLKVFLTATSSERARRRASELERRGFQRPDLAELQSQIEERDRLDSTRSTAPLVKADDAYELVTDDMTIQEVIDSLVDLFRMRVPDEVWPTTDRH